MSDSVRPHGPQPTRLLHPWDFPGKSTGVGCRCLLQVIAVDAFYCRDHREIQPGKWSLKLTTVWRPVSHVSVQLSFCVRYVLLTHFCLWCKQAVFQWAQFWCQRLNWFGIICDPQIQSCKATSVKVKKIQ